MMTNIQKHHDGTISIIVDKTIYDDWVIEKVMYWWSSDYIITRKNSDDLRTQTITMSLKDGHIESPLSVIKEKISNDFIDYKNRQTIAKETSNLRDLLFAKAFANSDDFVEFTFQD